jgi:hypothetical protein
MRVPQADVEHNTSAQQAASPPWDAVRKMVEDIMTGIMPTHGDFDNCLRTVSVHSGSSGGHCFKELEAH